MLFALEEADQVVAAGEAESAEAAPAERAVHAAGRRVNRGSLPAHLPRIETVVDIGSGAGLPGLVLALVRPDLSVTLVEPLLRRATFLGEAVEQLGLDRVGVVRARVEELPKKARFDVVTARAVAPLDKLAAWCARRVAPGGRMLALKGERATEELAAARGSFARLGLDEGRVVRVGEGIVDPPTTLVELRRPGGEEAPLPSGQGQKAESPHGGQDETEGRSQ